MGKLGIVFVMWLVVGVAVGAISCCGTIASTPAASQELQLEIVSVTYPTGTGAYATLQAKTVPNASCNITVYGKSGPSKAQGLNTKQADSSGNVSWTWNVGNMTAPGTWRIVVTATLAGKKVSQQTYFTVQ